MNEIWKPIEGTDGKYEVSNTGKVRSLNYLGHGKTQELKPGKDQKGYLRIGLTVNGKKSTAKMHRLVASAFVPNPDKKPEVNHINGVKTDNRAENLEWATARENTLHAYETGLKEKTREHCRHMGQSIGRENLAKEREAHKTPVIAIRLSDGAIFEYASQGEAAAATGASQPNIWKVLNSQRGYAKGYVFKYKEVVEK